MFSRTGKNRDRLILKGLLVDFVKERGITTIVRGLRAISDFEIEFQMALMNRKIEPRIETIFFVPSESYSFLSSKLVKEIYLLGGEVPSMLPAIVDRKLKERYPPQFVNGSSQCKNGNMLFQPLGRVLAMSFSTTKHHQGDQKGKADIDQDCFSVSGSNRGG